MSGRHERDVREAIAVSLGVMYGGAVLLILVDRLFGLGAVAGVIGFSALPLMAVFAAIQRLETRPWGIRRSPR